MASKSKVQKEKNWGDLLREKQKAARKRLPKIPWGLDPLPTGVYAKLRVMLSEAALAGYDGIRYRPVEILSVQQTLWIANAFSEFKMNCTWNSEHGFQILL